jgi:PrgI family protein/AAA-like domain
MSEPVTIQADLDHPDRVLAGLTARQVAILAATALLLYSGWLVANPWVPTLWLLMFAVPFAVGGVALALFRRDGISLDRLAGAALLYRLRPRHLTGPPRPAGEPVPSWLQERTEALPGDPDPGRGEFPSGRVGRLSLPVRGVEDLAAGGVGVLDLGSHGLAVLAAASPVPFALRAPGDQRSLLDCFAHLLLSADGPMQILVRAVPLDLRSVLGEIAHAATTLAHPALAAAAAGHHDYLAEMANTHDLLTRQVVLVLRNPTPTSSSARAAVARERLLARLADALRELGEPGAISLADRLTPYSSGSFSSLFNGPTTTAPVGHLVVFSLKDLPDELRGIGTLLALYATWRTFADPTHRRPRLVVVDEAWLLLQHPAGAAFLLRLAKSARKHWAGLTLVTQDAADVLATDLGRSVVSNAATHILLRTAAQAAAAITTEFGLSPPEQQFLPSAATGSGLLITHTGHHIPFTAHASTAEDTLITSDPAQLAATPTHADNPQLPQPPPDEPTSPKTPPWEQDGPDPL